MKVAMLLVVILCMGVFSRSWAGELSQIRERISRLENSLQNSVLIFGLSYSIHCSGGKDYPHRGGEYVVKVEKGRQLSVIRFERLSVSAREQNSLHYTSEWWYTQDSMGVILNTPDGKKIMTCFPCQSMGIGCDMHRVPLDYGFHRFDPVLLTCSNLLYISDIKWQIVSGDEKTWEVLGAYEAQVGQKGTVRAIFSKPEARLQRLEVVESFQHGDKVRNTLQKLWKIQKFIEVNGQLIPEVITVVEKRSYATIESTLRLQSSRPLLKEPQLRVPLGTDVTDYRLVDYKDLLKAVSVHEEFREQQVKYAWTGRLPSKDELKQLAYQQGSLLPPETPQRRYSFWMFLPAIVLFGLALLFYLRRRR